MQLSPICIRQVKTKSILKINTRGRSGTYAKPFLRPAKLELTTNHLQYLQDLRLFLQGTRIGHTPMVLE